MSSSKKVTKRIPAGKEYEFFTDAVKKGKNDHLKTNIALLLLSGSGGAKQDPDEAIPLLEERVKDKDAEAMWILAYCNGYGIGTEKDVKRAASLLKASAKAGSDLAKAVEENEHWDGKLSLDVSWVAKELLPFVPLTDLNIKMDTFFVEEAGMSVVRDLCPSLGKNTTLTKLDLGWNNMEDDSVKALCEALKTNSTLTSLQLYGDKGESDEVIEDNGAVSLGNLLADNSTLTELDLSHNSILEYGAYALAQCLVWNTALTYLNLYRNEIEDEGAARMSEMLAHNKGLMSLNLSDNVISDTGSAKLAKVLVKNTTLTELNLGMNLVTNKSAKEWSKTLLKNSTLTKLVLIRNEIGDAGATALMESKEKNKVLTVLELGGNEMISSKTKKKYKITDPLFLQSY